MGTDLANVWVKIIIRNMDNKKVGERVTRLARVPCVGEHLTFTPNEEIYEVTGVEHCAWVPREDWSAAILVKEIDG